MAVSLVLLAAVIAVVNGLPELTDGPKNEERVLQIQCSIKLEVVYPSEEGELPYPLCTSWCPMGEEPYIDGVVFKRMAELEAYGLMVEMTYKNGSLKDCKMVPFHSAVNSTARQEAQKRCMESFCSRVTESQDEALVLSFTERIPDALPAIPLHQLLEGFTRVGNSYYMISPYAMSWHDAVNYCNRLGAPLAFIESSHEQHSLQEVLSVDVWIDLNDIVAEGIFVNAGHNPITYSSWHPGQPNNYKNDEDCGMLYVNFGYLWNDANCNFPNIYALCEHPLVNEPQAQYSCPPGYWQHGASCYILSFTADTYSRGEEFCLLNEAYPVFINSQGEQDFVKGILTERTFFGYSDREVEGTFVSRRFGVPLFKRWASGQPNNNHGDEDCVCVEPSYQFLWHDYNCDFKSMTLCEKAAVIRDQPVIPAA